MTHGRYQVPVDSAHGSHGSLGFISTEQSQLELPRVLLLRHDFDDLEDIGLGKFLCKEIML